MQDRIYLPKSAVILHGASCSCAAQSWSSAGLQPWYRNTQSTIAPVFSSSKVSKSKASLKRLISDSGTDISHWNIDDYSKKCRNLETTENFRYIAEHDRWEKYDKLNRHQRKSLQKMGRDRAEAAPHISNTHFEKT